MSNFEHLAGAVPVGPLKLIALPGCEEIVRQVNGYLVEARQELIQEFPEKADIHGCCADNYIIECSLPRFGTGEGKGILNESARGTDLFIMVDVCNYSVTYKAFGRINHMSPDDHFQNLKRVISAVTGKAHRINVIMPFLYEGRQHRRSARESLDCAVAMQELANMGVANILTFDAHDPRVMNAIPLHGFDNFFPSYQFMQALIDAYPDISFSKDSMVVISPDEGAMSRAIFFANILGVDMGMFYKRRDYSQIINGKNPIVAHEYLGDSVEGKDCVVIDDMISSGGSMLDVASQLKERGARNVYICATFGLFTDGFSTFDDYYEKGLISRVITTDLVYQQPDLLEKPWYTPAKMERYLASIIDTLNHDVSIDKVRDNTYKINQLLERHHGAARH
ncbi:MAG: ribose-phosphate pyrophosphokinase [Eubacterium sp.]|nr:ribose-phosphate pyrophosphokinase [Eubacterium sp.]